MFSGSAPKKYLFEVVLTIPEGVSILKGMKYSKAVVK
jgi:hypothetical protein